MTKSIIKDKKLMMQEIQKLISEGKTVSITAKGYSMNPFIRHMQDIITIGPWKDDDLKRGTAALVQTDSGNYVFHRIIRRDRETIILEGDGNVGLTEKATVNNVIGIMHGITRNGREYTSKSLLWKTYSFIWLLLGPLKRYPLAIWRKLTPQKPLR